MLHSLHVRNFTVFADAKFEFGPGLNVVVGTNGTGKSHVLKLGYALSVAYATSRLREGESLRQSGSEPNVADVLLATNIIECLHDVFLPKLLSKLVRYSASAGKHKQAGVQAAFGADATGSMDFVMAAEGPNSTGNGVDLRGFVAGKLTERPVFIPAKEMLSLMPGIIGLSERYNDLLDLTYTGLAKLLSVPLLRKVPSYAQPVLDGLGQLLGGTIESENGRFYLAPKHGERVEIGLVAEGYRKLGTLAYLLANGSLNQNTTLYWDEPEANLNPSLMRELARVLVTLAKEGFQIILATHSLFLLKEFHIQAQRQKTTVRYFGLNAEPGQATQVTMRNSFELLPDIVALDAELNQTFDYEEALNANDVDDSGR